ncbi:hypothetical protein D3P09_08260 [Paenibacillus pinisoli]|uniref:Uncharacterized protein n=1 Tax=Paenibacillus pinisoli TaxID=1276110 RepID=A0A3A6PD54_9BACL|nr:tetratricopeptide repeat protein [Paenibacillus pinisoli]RJX39422.1 hypothetical protein D3P09_08260 [Paenibacillus pinisoli]
MTKYHKYINSEALGKGASAYTEGLDERKAKKLGLGILRVSFALIVILIILGIAYIMDKPYKRYDQAKSLMENYEFEQAMDIFWGIRDIKDSSVMMEENKYKLAISYLENKDFETSIKLFKELKGYANSAYFINIAKYSQAKAYVLEGQYNKALKLVEEIAKSEGTDNILADIYFHLAENYFKDRIYKEALHYLNLVSPQNEAVKELRTMTNYELGWNALIDKDYSGAIFYFNEIDAGYEDVSERITEANYKLAIQFYEEGKFLRARTIFQQLNGYKESEKYLEDVLFLDSFTGTWVSKPNYYKIIIAGWDIYIYFERSYSTEKNLFDSKLTRKGNRLSTPHEDYYIKDGKLYEENIYETKVYTKESISTYVPK